MQNYYEMFGLSPSASAEEIKELIHNQLRLWSLRINAPKAERRQQAERMMRILEEMETILLDEQKRAEYDRSLQMGRSGAIPVEEEKGQEDLQAERWTAQEIGEKLAEGWQLLQRGKDADALFLAQQLTSRAPHEAGAWALLGRARLNLGETEKAIKPLVKACDLEPNNPSYAHALGEVFEKMGRLDRAEEQYQSALALDPQRTDYKYTLSRLYFKTQKVREGLRLLEQCLKEAPENPRYQKELVRAYMELACSSWTVISPGHPVLPAGRYPTDKRDIKMAEVYLNRADAIPFEDPNLRAELNRIRTDIREKKGRTFTGSWTAVIISFISLIITDLIHFSWLNTFFIALPVLYIISAQTPLYRIYRKGIQGEIIHTDFAYLFERLKERFGNYAAYLSAVLIYLLYLPVTAYVLSIVIIYNFYRNYLISSFRA
jgi:tetratricopeptide (TPR) repeat protein